MYKPQFFNPKELASKEIYDKYGDSILAFFPDYSLEGLDRIRVLVGKPIYICTWSLKNCPIAINYEQSGLRDWECEIGAKNSNHKKGNTFDLKCPALSHEAFYNTIKSNYINLKIARMEAMKYTVGKWVSWVHAEFGISQQLYEFKP